MFRTRRVQLIVFVSVPVLLLALAGGCGSRKAVISSITPGSGPAGVRFKLFGKNFGKSRGNGAVRFGTQTANVSSWSDTSISAVVPGSLSGSTYTVSVVTKEGPSNQVHFTVNIEVTAASPLQTMIDYLKKKGLVTSGVTFGVVSTSKTDPNWKLDKGSKAGEQPAFFILHKGGAGWTVVDYGTSFTAAKMKADGAPGDLAPPEPASSAPSPAK